MDPASNTSKTLETLLQDRSSTAAQAQSQPHASGFRGPLIQREHGEEEQQQQQQQQQPRTSNIGSKRSLSAPFQFLDNRSFKRQKEQHGEEREQEQGQEQQGHFHHHEVPRTATDAFASSSTAQQPCTESIHNKEQHHQQPPDTTNIPMNRPATPQQQTVRPSPFRAAPATATSGMSSSASKPYAPNPALAPSSPRTDPASAAAVAAVYASASPASVLPRHSRGLDFSRAATQLHHSMIADASPDTSPVVATRAMAIPRRRRSGERGGIGMGMGMGMSGGIGGGIGIGGTGSMSGSPSGGAVMSGAMPSSMNSTNMNMNMNMIDVDSSDSSDEDDDDEEDYDEAEMEGENDDDEDVDDVPFQNDGDDMMLSTPRSATQQGRSNRLSQSSSSMTPFSPNLMLLDTPSAAAHTLPYPASALNVNASGANPNPPTTTTPRSGTKASFKNYQRNRLRHNRGRHPYHQGAATRFSNNSPSGSLFPGVLRSVETVAGGHFPATAAMWGDVSSLHRGSNGSASGSGTGNEMQLSDMSDDEGGRGEQQQQQQHTAVPGGGAMGTGSPSSSSIATNSNPEPGRPGVIRKAITRPRNLMPKPKSFSRIRAQLLEENAPVDFDVKREAEVIRQVRESEPDPLQQQQQQQQAANAIANPYQQQQEDPRDPSLFPFGSFSRDTESSSNSPNPFSNPPLFSLSGNTNANASNTSNSANASSAAAAAAAGPIPSGAGSLAGAGAGAIAQLRSPRYETPPPPPSRQSSGDFFMETPPPFSASASNVAATQSQFPSSSAGGRAVPFGLQQGAAMTTAAAGTGKRRRDDFMDFSTWKRRAVSPSVSVVSAQSSPKVAPFNRPGSISSESGGNNSGSFGGGNGSGTGTGTGTSGSVKRIGLQGMKETNEGIMNMRID